MVRNTTMKTIIEVAAKSDGSVKSELGKAAKEIDALKKKSENTSIMPNIQSGADADSALTEAAKKAANTKAKINELGESINSAGLKIQGVGAKLMPVSLAAQGAVGASIKMANDYDNGMAKVNTIANLSSTKLKGLSNDLLKVSSDTGKSATEIAEAAYQSLSASVPTNQVAKFTKVAANLAKTGFTDTASSVDVLSTAINAYGLKTSQASKLSDMLIQTQNRGKTTVNELASQMGNVIPTASALGVNMANLSTGYVQLTKQGINTASATTQLRAIFNELSKSGTTVDKTLRKQTGKSFTDLMKSGKSLGDIMGILSKSVKGNKTEFKNLWSNTRAGSGALAILNAGVKDFNGQLSDMNNATGNTANALKRLETPGVLAKKSINKLKNSGIELGETFLDSAAPAITKVSDAVSKLTSDFDKLDPETKKLIAGGVSLAAIASPVLIGTGKVVSGLGKLIIKTSGATSKVISFVAGLRKVPSGADEAAEGVGSLAESIKDLPAATGAASAGEHVFTASSAASGVAVAGALAAVVGLSAVMLSQRHNFQASSSEVDRLTKKYDSAANKTGYLISSTESQIKSTRSSNSALASNGRVAESLTSKIKALSSVENKSAAQKQKLKAEVSALNSVVPGLNLSYNAEKDTLSKTNGQIEKNIALLKQQSIAKQAAKNASGLNDKRGKLMIQQSTNEVNIEDQSAKVDAISKKYNAALSKFNKLQANPNANAGDVAKARQEVSKYNSMLTKGQKSLDAYKSKQSQLNKELGKFDKEISINGFTSALAEAKQAGKKIPTSLAAGMRSSMSVLPTAAKELETTVKYKSVINKAKDAGIKIPKSLSEKIITGKITVKKANEQMDTVIKYNSVFKKAKNAGSKIPKYLSDKMSSGKISVKKAGEQMANVVKFEKATSKAKKAGIKIPKSLASGVNSGKISASKAASRVSEMIKFDKAVKKAKSQGLKIPKNLASAVASGKLTAQQASQKLGNASTSKLDKSKDARSKGNKTNQTYSNAIGQTSAPRSAGRRAANAGVNPFKGVPQKVSDALSGLGSRISKAFSFTPPHIKTPHFSTSGKLSVGKGGISLPKVSVSWYKSGGIMTRPTVFGSSGNKLLAGGEAGPEGIIPLNKLWKNMDRSISNTVSNNVSRIYNMAGPISNSSDGNTTVNNYNAVSNSYYNSNASSASRSYSFLSDNKSSGRYQNENRSYAYNSNSRIANRASSIRSLTDDHSQRFDMSNLYNMSESIFRNLSDIISHSNVNNAMTTKESIDATSKTFKSMILNSSLISSASRISNLAKPLNASNVSNAYGGSSILNAVGNIISEKKLSMFSSSDKSHSYENSKILRVNSIRNNDQMNILKSGMLNHNANEMSFVIRNGSLDRSMIDGSRISETIRNGSLVREVQYVDGYGARRIANDNRSKHKSININGITFSPNITIKGNASKQDIIEALKECEDELKDYLKQLQSDEEDALLC